MNTRATSLFFSIMETAQYVHNANMQGDDISLDYLKVLAQQIKEKAQEILDL